MARPSRNGVAERKVKTPRDLKPLAKERKPIGRVPEGWDAAEKKMWYSVVKEFHWLDHTHRRIVASLAKHAARVEFIDNVFRQRKVEFAEQGLPAEGVFLGDDNKRHPLFIELMNIEKEMRAVLMEIGATPASQMKMMSGVTGDEKVKEDLDDIRESFFR